MIDVILVFVIAILLHRIYTQDKKIRELFIYCNSLDERLITQENRRGAPIQEIREQIYGLEAKKQARES